MCANLLLRFKEDQKGSATVESLFWMPVFFYLFILITDVSFIFYGKTQALRIVQDGNRAYSVNRFDTDAEAGRYIQTLLRTISPTATATTTVTNGVIETNATVQVNDLMAVGSIPNFVGLEIDITAQHFKED